MASRDGRSARFVPRWSGLLLLTPAVTAAHSADGRHSMSLRRILVVDDEPDIRHLLVDLVSQCKHAQDYSVSTASDGAGAALQAVLRERPDLVLLDNKRAGMTGLEVLKQIHRIDLRIHVILVTRELTSGDAAEALRSGAFSYVPKPLDARHIDALVALALTRPWAGP